MLVAILILITHFSGKTFYDNMLGGDFLANAFIHTQTAPTASYDNPSLLGLLDNIYAFTTESPRNNPTFYVDTEGRPKNTIIGIISPKLSLFYRNIFNLNRRIDTPYLVDKEKYSEYTLGIASSNQTVTLGINLKYLTSTYAYAYNDTLILDFARGFSEDIGITFHNQYITIGGAYNHVYGILKWDSEEVTRIPSRYFISISMQPFKDLLYLNGEYEKVSFSDTAYLKGSFLFNIPYTPHKIKTGIFGGYLKGKDDYLLTYGFTINKGVARINIGFDNKGNLAVTLFTSGQ